MESSPAKRFSGQRFVMVLKRTVWFAGFGIVNTLRKIKSPKIIFLNRVYDPE